MRNRYVSAIVLALVLLPLVTLAAWAATASFTPPAREGDIFAVINFARDAGVNQRTSLAVSWGPLRRTDTVGAPYGSCATATPAGFVLMIRSSQAKSYPFTLSTTGTIVRGPYQGVAPPEISHPCYKFLKMRFRF